MRVCVCVSYCTQHALHLVQGRAARQALIGFLCVMPSWSIVMQKNGLLAKVNYLKQRGDETFTVLSQYCEQHDRLSRILNELAMRP